MTEPIVLRGHSDLHRIFGPTGYLAEQMATGDVFLRCVGVDTEGVVHYDISLRAKKTPESWDCTISAFDRTAVKRISHDVAAQEFEDTILWLCNFVFSAPNRTN